MDQPVEDEGPETASRGKAVIDAWQEALLLAGACLFEFRSVWPPFSGPESRVSCAVEGRRRRGSSSSPVRL